MIKSEFMPRLKHAFFLAASILSDDSTTLPRMGYGDRLGTAIELAGSSRKAVAAALGISPQAVGQAIRGETVAHTAENQAKASRLLDVDYYWLATGQGRPRPAGQWPYESFTPTQYRKLDLALRKEVEERLLGAIVMIERSEPGNGTDG